MSSHPIFNMREAIEAGVPLQTDADVAAWNAQVMDKNAVERLGEEAGRLLSGNDMQAMTSEVHQDGSVTLTAKGNKESLAQIAEKLEAQGLSVSTSTHEVYGIESHKIEIESVGTEIKDVARISNDISRAAGPVHVELPPLALPDIAYHRQDPSQDVQIFRDDDPLIIALAKAREMGEERGSPPTEEEFTALVAEASKGLEGGETKEPQGAITPQRTIAVGGADKSSAPSR